MAGYDFIRKAVAALARRDRELMHFGASRHRYRFNPPLAEREVTAFEQRHGIRLPQDYRGFLIEVGNGGAGPHYGVFRLGEIDGLRDDEPWKEGAFVGILREPLQNVVCAISIHRHQRKLKSSRPFWTITQTRAEQPPVRLVPVTE